MSASARTMTSDALVDHRECAENYHRVIVCNRVFRVAVCRDGIQWLLQRRRRTISPGGAAWDNIGYFTDREALKRFYRAQVDHEATELNALPRYFERLRGED